MEEKLAEIAKPLIENYLKQNYLNKENFEQEMKRIEEIFDKVEISFKKHESGSQKGGSNHGEGKITIEVIDKENVYWEEAQEKITTAVHEIYHSISKTKRERKNTFLEEGYVTYITRETIKHFLEEPVDIAGIDRNELKTILQKQELENGYKNASEFVCCMQLVMEEHGFDSKYEYLFDGKERLFEIANGISPEFGKIIKEQDRKNKLSKMIRREKEFFRKCFKEIDFSKTTETIIGMNPLLQNYLINSGEIDKDKRIYEIINKFNPEGIAEKKLYSEIKGLSNDEIANKVYESFPKGKIDYQNYGDMNKIAKQMISIEKIYTNSSALMKPQIYGGMEFYSIVIAYDLNQNGIKEPTRQDILEYCEKLVHNKNLEIQMLDQVSSYINYVQGKCGKGKNIKEILDEHLTNNAVLMTNMKKIEESELTYWEKIEQMANSTLKQKEENQENFNYCFYREILDMDIEQIKNGQLYEKDDYEKFVSKMNEIFEKIEMPEAAKKTGFTPEMIFLKNVSENLDISSNDFLGQITNILDIINDKNPDLGEGTGFLDDLAVNINVAYEMLKEEGKQEKIKEFSNKFLIGYSRNLSKGTTTEFRNNEGLSYYEANKNLEEILQDIIVTPEFYQNTNELQAMFFKFPTTRKLLYKQEEFRNRFYKKLQQEKLEEQKNLQNKPVLDRKTVVNMAKNPEVQYCQTEAHEAFEELSTPVAEKNQKEISEIP